MQNTIELVKQYGQVLSNLKHFRQTGNDPATNINFDRIDKLDKEMPSGSGFDRGTTLDVAKSTSNKLIFVTSFHHMDDNGYYDGWTDHKVTVTALFDGFEVAVSGSNKRDIKDYIADTFHYVLSEEVANVSI